MSSEVECALCDGKGWYWDKWQHYQPCIACGGRLVHNPPGSGRVTISDNIILGDE